MELLDYMLTLSAKGYFCSQILMQLALDMDEADNPDLIRAMSGLNGGMGFTGHTCGVLTAGCCFIGYFCGKGEDDEIEASNMNAMIDAYVQWFTEDLTAEHCSTECHAILDGDMKNQMRICPQLVSSAYEKLVTLLQEGNVL